MRNMLNVYAKPVFKFAKEASKSKFTKKIFFGLIGSYSVLFFNDAASQRATNTAALLSIQDAMDVCWGEVHSVLDNIVDRTDDLMNNSAINQNGKISKDYHKYARAKSYLERVIRRTDLVKFKPNVPFAQYYILNLIYRQIAMHEDLKNWKDQFEEEVNHEKLYLEFSAKMYEAIQCQEKGCVEEACKSSAGKAYDLANLIVSNSELFHRGNVEKAQNTEEQKFRRTYRKACLEHDKELLKAAESLKNRSCKMVQ